MSSLLKVMLSVSPNVFTEVLSLLVYSLLTSFSDYCLLYESTSLDLLCVFFVSSLTVLLP